jgi:integrase
MAGRPPLDVGTYGRIWVSDGAAPYKARARYRDKDGRVRTVAKFGQTKSAATRALKAVLLERQGTTSGRINADTRVEALAAAWLIAVDTSDRSPRTKEHYTYAVGRYVLPTIGRIRLREADTATCDDALKLVTDRHGPAAAKTARAVLTGMFGLAVRRGAITVNPFRETDKIRGGTRHTPRALTPAEADDLCDRLRGHQRALDYDLPDLVEFLLGTGARIGEACAARDTVLDLEVGTWEINATITRVKGQGVVIQERPKTAAGWRVLRLPEFAVAMLQRRAGELRLRAPSGVVFGSPHKRALRDPSNTAADLRAVLNDIGYDWVTSHTFRKTVATRLDDAGMSARVIADQLGHAQPSMTTDVYMGRNVVSAAAAKILDR